MSDHSINITLSEESSGAATSWWLRLAPHTQDDNTATISEVAATVDKLFDITSCEGSESTGGSSSADQIGDIEPPVEESVFDKTVASLMPATNCLFNDSWDYECLVDVHRSDNSENYKLIVKEGFVVETVRVHKRIMVIVDIKDSDNIELKYNILGEVDMTLRGSTSLDVVRDGNLFKFNEKLSGTLHASFITEYDTVTLNVKGTDGKATSGSLLAFYHGLVEETTIDPPKVDEEFSTPCINGSGGGSVKCTDDHICYKYVYHYALEECTGTLAYSYDEQPTEVSCPEGWCFDGHDTIRETVFDGYVSSEIIESVNEPLFYEERCCDPPPSDMVLPRCKDNYSSNPGGVSINKYFYNGLYGPRTQFVAVRPTGPEGCGKKLVTYNVQQRNCCEDFTDIIIDRENSSDIINTNGSGFVYFSGGDTSVFVKVRGSGFWLNANHDIRDAVVSTKVILIYTLNACGTCSISISDGCSSASYTIRSTEGKWRIILNSDGGQYTPVISPGMSIGLGHFGVIPGDYSSDAVVITEKGIAIGQLVGYYSWSNLHYEACCIDTQDISECCKNSADYGVISCSIVSGIMEGWSLAGQIQYDIRELDVNRTYDGQDNCNGIYTETRVAVQDPICPIDSPFLCKTRGISKYYDSRGTKSWEWACS